MCSSVTFYDLKIHRRRHKLSLFERYVMRVLSKNLSLLCFYEKASKFSVLITHCDTLFQHTFTEVIFHPLAYTNVSTCAVKLGYDEFYRTIKSIRYNRKFVITVIVITEFDCTLKLKYILKLFAKRRLYCKKDRLHCPGNLFLSRWFRDNRALSIRAAIWRNTERCIFGIDEE